MKKTVITLASAFTLTAGLFSATGHAAEHTVKEGDTLWNLSQQYKVSVDQIKSANGLSSDIIYPNDTLTIGGQTANKASQASVTYVVQQGDTLAKIAQAYGVSVNQLVAWNKLSSEDMIFAGDTLALNKGSAHLAKVTSPAQPVQQASAQQSAPKAPAQQAKKQASQQAPAQISSSVARTYTMEATAYTAYCAGCSGVTANGTDLRANPGLKVIAVDPSVIPLGTKVWVEGYGEAIAADTGGAIKGNKIDVFVPTTDQAYAWGRKTVTVKVLN